MDGEVIEYVLGARQGQTMYAHISSKSNNARLLVTDPSGQDLSGDEPSNDFEGELPASGDYRVSINWIRDTPTRYTLELTVR